MNNCFEPTNLTPLLFCASLLLVTKRYRKAQNNNSLKNSIAFYACYGYLIAFSIQFYNLLFK